MNANSKQTLLGGIALLCLFILAPACADIPLLSAAFVGIACACSHYGQLGEVKNDEE